MVKDFDTEQWIFPSCPLKPRKTFKESRLELFDAFNNDSWRYVEDDHIPEYIEERDLTEAERNNPSNSKAKGVRTYYFGARHLRGRVTVNEQLFKDFNWVPKPYFNKYMTREMYNKFNDVLDLK